MLSIQFKSTIDNKDNSIDVSDNSIDVSDNSIDVSDKKKKLSKSISYGSTKTRLPRNKNQQGREDVKQQSSQRRQTGTHNGTTGHQNIGPHRGIFHQSKATFQPTS
jgi:hypothetical protein